MAEQHASLARVPQIELLRVLATAGVFLYHLWTVIPLSSDAMILGSILARLSLLGTLGVIIFNGITGFALAVSYLGQDTSRPLPGGWEFLRPRFGRICQHYYPVLGLWTIAWVLLDPHAQGWWNILVAFVSHLVFVHTLHANTFFAIVPALWWLGMLAQFYLLYPWLLRFFRWISAGKACVVICLASWSLWGALTFVAHHWPGSRWPLIHYLAYFNLPVRLPEFALGMWLAAVWNRGVPLVHGRPHTATPRVWMAKVVSSLLVILVLFLLLQETWLQHMIRPFGHIYLVSWCVLLALAVLRWSLAVHLGSTRRILDLAAASYGIYLLHQPLLSYANEALTGLLNPPVRFGVLLIGVWLICYWAAMRLNILLYRLFR